MTNLSGCVFKTVDGNLDRDLNPCMEMRPR